MVAVRPAPRPLRRPERHRDFAERHTPSMTAQVAKVCRRMCGVTSSPSPAAFRASSRRAVGGRSAGLELRRTCARRSVGAIGACARAAASRAGPACGRFELSPSARPRRYRMPDEDRRSRPALSAATSGAGSLVPGAVLEADQDEAGDMGAPCRTRRAVRRPAPSRAGAARSACCSGRLVDVPESQARPRSAGRPRPGSANGPGPGPSPHGDHDPGRAACAPCARSRTRAERTPSSRRTVCDADARHVLEVLETVLGPDLEAGLRLGRPPGCVGAADLGRRVSDHLPVEELGEVRERAPYHVGRSVCRRAHAVERQDVRDEDASGSPLPKSGRASARDIAAALLQPLRAASTAARPELNAAGVAMTQRLSRSFQ